MDNFSSKTAGEDIEDNEETKDLDAGAIKSAEGEQDLSLPPLDIPSTELNVEEELPLEEKQAEEDLTKYVQKVSFDLLETKEVERDGVRYGIIEGYASTYGNVDRVKDIVMPGAFTKTIRRHMDEDRTIRMFYQHDAKEIIGGFPAALMQEDPQGLRVVGEINLDVQRGREVYALAKQKVLTDFSIGYTVKDYKIKDGARQLLEIELWEVSVVAEPANTKARIIQVKEVLKTKRDAEKLLRDSGFSRSAAAYVSSLIDETKIGLGSIEEDNQPQRDAAKEDSELIKSLTILIALVDKL